MGMVGTRLKVLVAPTAFKGTLSASVAARSIATGARAAGGDLELDLAPLADGGDGTIEALSMSLGGEQTTLQVVGPTGSEVAAKWLRCGREAVVELASACGIALVSGELEPLAAHTFGLGQVIAHCLEAGEKDIVITVGGSASTDGGTGALRALGARFLDVHGAELPLGGGSLIDLVRLELDALAKWADRARLRVATDVRNPLLGPGGAAFVFAPQKGATPAQCQLLDSGLARLADLLEAATGRALRALPGSGAAGGAAFGLACALDAGIISGFHWLSELIRLPDKIAAADVVVTGEGKIDSQTLSGKAIGELAQICSSLNRPLWVIAADSEPGIDWSRHGITRLVTVAKAGTIARSADLTAAARELFSNPS